MSLEMFRVILGTCAGVTFLAMLVGLLWVSMANIASYVVWLLSGKDCGKPFEFMDYNLDLFVTILLVSAPVGLLAGILRWIFRV